MTKKNEGCAVHGVAVNEVTCIVCTWVDKDKYLTLCKSGICNELVSDLLHGEIDEALAVEVASKAIQEIFLRYISNEDYKSGSLTEQMVLYFLDQINFDALARNWIFSKIANIVEN